MPQLAADQYSLKTLDHDDLDLGAGVFDGWEMEYVQLSRGRFAAATREVRLPGVQMFLESTTVRTHQYGTARPRSYVFGIPIEMQAAGHFNGEPWCNAICVFRGDSEIDVVVPAMSLLVVAIDASLIEQRFLLNEGVELPQRYLQRCAQHAGAVQRTRLAGALKDIMQHCLSDTSLLSQASTRRALQLTILELLDPLLTMGAGCGRPELGPFSRLELVRRARAYILEHVDMPLQIGDVCQALRVSRRTLQFSFQEVLGINPVAWLRLLRLSGARKALQNHQDLHVRDVLARWGFWHPSRFSSEYRQMFLELPSETLRGLARTICMPTGDPAYILPATNISPLQNHSP